MTVPTRFAAAVDAVLDGRATGADVELVESAVLSDAACRRHYVEAVNVHAALLWDNAPAASTVVPVSKAAKPSKRRWVAAALTTAAAALIAAVLLPSPEPKAVAQNDLPPAVVTPAADPVETPPLIAETSPRPERIEEPPAVEIVPEGRFEEPDPRDGLAAFIDGRLAAAWAENDVTPAAEASPEDWYRRVSLDIRGRIPTPAELDAFLAADPDTRRAYAVDSMLASGEYARHFATVWTNLLVGRAPERAEFGERLRPYLEEAFALGRSWGEVAGELVAARGPQSNPPTNFLLAHMNNEAVPATAVTARVLLGRQVQCAQCHAHPFNDWQQDEFWRLNAFFAGCDVRSQDGQLALVDSPEDGPVFFEDRRGLMKVAYPVFEGSEAKDADRRAELARLMTAGDRTQVAEAMVNRVWSHFHGAAFTRSADDLGPHSSVSHPELFDRLVRAFVASGYDVRELVRWAAGSRSYALAAAPHADDSPRYGRLPLFTGVYDKPLSAEQLYDSLLVAATGSARPVPGVPSREEWVADFYAARPDEENGEETTFEPSASRALELMNGDLVAGLLDSPAASALSDLSAERATFTEKAAALCRLTLGRDPSEAEAQTVGRLLRLSAREYAKAVPPEAAQRAAVADAFWAYVNSSGFAVNR